MPTETTSSFLECLKKSELLTQKEFDEAMMNYTGDTEDTARLCQFFVRSKILTEFQVKFLKAGKYKGLTIGPYHIQSKLGVGGMGIVYLAEHKKMGRRVAIKILPEDRLKDQLAVERFYREARSVATLDHVNIVKAHDVNEHEGCHYLVMEYVDGTNLQKLVEKKGFLPWKAVCNILIQVCRGLQHAHERNFVHRDIKPANLLLEKTGQVKILDFGLARSLEKRDDNLTADLSEGKDVQGSIDFVSPEQAIANAAIDIRADIYSLGATAHVLLTGQSPVHGTPAQKLVQHQLQMPTQVHLIRPEIPVALSEIVSKMLAKQPSQRYSTPDEVIQALRAVTNPAVNLITDVTILNDINTAPLDQPTTGILANTTAEVRVQETTSTKRITKKLPKSKKFKKKQSKSDMTKWIVIAASLLILSGGIWGLVALFSGVSAERKEEISYQADDIIKRMQADIDKAHKNAGNKQSTKPGGDSASGNSFGRLRLGTNPSNNKKPEDKPAQPEGGNAQTPPSDPPPGIPNVNNDPPPGIPTNTANGSPDSSQQNQNDKQPENNTGNTQAGTGALGRSSNYEDPTTGGSAVPGLNTSNTNAPGNSNSAPPVNRPTLGGGNPPPSGNTGNTSANNQQNTPGQNTPGFGSYNPNQASAPNTGSSSANNAGANWRPAVNRNVAARNNQPRQNTNNRSTNQPGAGNASNNNTGSGTAGGSTPPPPGSLNSGATSNLLTVGKTMIDIVGEDLDGKSMKLSDFDGNVILISFWGYHSPDCVSMFFYDNSLITRHNGRPFVMVGVNTDTSEQVIAKGLQAYKQNRRSFKNKLPDGTLLTKALNITALPSMILVDHRGIIRKVWTGVPDTRDIDFLVDSVVRSAETAKSAGK